MRLPTMLHFTCFICRGFVCDRCFLLQLPELLMEIFVLPREYVTCRGGKACLCGHALKIFVPSADGPLLNFHYSFHRYHQNQVRSSPTLSVSLPKLPIPGNWSWSVRLYVDVAPVRTVWRVSCGPIRMSRTKQSTLLTYSSRSVV